MIHPKVVVKAVEENTAYNIVSAEATGAKKVTVTLNKAVTDTTNVTVALKKGAVAKDSKFAVEDGKIVITTDTKLMAGNYNVTIGGLETTDLTSTFDVDKDETLTSYEIGAELIPDSYASTSASIYYKALNQYGEMMNADAPTATCTFASGTQDVAVTATATREGRIDVTDINTALTIVGTKGSVILVDQTLGVNQTAEVTYSSPATAAEVVVDGMYNVATSEMQDMTANDQASDYYLLMTIKDQYGHQVEYKDIKSKVTLTVAGGVTNLEKGNANASDKAEGLKDFSIGETDYIAATFKDNITLKDGSATLTLVNDERGLLLTQTIEVAEYVIISDFVVSADNGIYDKQKNEMTYEATDSNGKAVTSYAVLKKQVPVGGQWSWEKQLDGSAKLIYEPNVGVSENASHTGSKLCSATFHLNSSISPHYKVKVQNFTVRQEREKASVYGLASDTATQFSSTTKKLSIDLNKIVFADQYANKVTKADDIYYKVVSGDPIAIVTGSSVNTVTQGSLAIKIVTSGSMNAYVTGSSLSGGTLEFSATNPSDYAVVYLKYYNEIKATKDQKAVSTDSYDYKFTVTCVNTEEISASSLKIKSVFDGYAEYVTGSALKSNVSPEAIKVTATVGGVETELAPSQYVIKSIKNGSITDEEKNAGVDTKTATVTVQVTTFDSDNNPTVTELSADYTISYADPYAASVTGVSSDGKKAMATTISSGALLVSGSAAKLNAELMQSLFTFKDQYGEEMAVTSKSGLEKKVSYTVVAKDTDNVRVYGEDANNVYATSTVDDTYTFTITAKTVDGKSVTKDFKVCFNNK